MIPSISPYYLSYMLSVGYLGILLCNGELMHTAEENIGKGFPLTKANSSLPVSNKTEYRRVARFIPTLLQGQDEENSTHSNKETHIEAPYKIWKIHKYQGINLTPLYLADSDSILTSSSTSQLRGSPQETSIPHVDTYQYPIDSYTGTSKVLSEYNDFKENYFSGVPVKDTPDKYGKELYSSPESPGDFPLISNHGDILLTNNVPEREENIYYPYESQYISTPELNSHEEVNPDGDGLDILSALYSSGENTGSVTSIISTLSSLRPLINAISSDENSLKALPKIIKSLAKLLPQESRSLSDSNFLLSLINSFSSTHQTPETKTSETYDGPVSTGKVKTYPNLLRPNSVDQALLELSSDTDIPDEIKAILISHILSSVEDEAKKPEQLGAKEVTASILGKIGGIKKVKKGFLSKLSGKKGGKIAFFDKFGIYKKGKKFGIFKKFHSKKGKFNILDKFSIFKKFSPSKLHLFKKIHDSKTKSLEYLLGSLKSVPSYISKIFISGNPKDSSTGGQTFVISSPKNKNKVKLVSSGTNKPYIIVTHPVHNYEHDEFVHNAEFDEYLPHPQYSSQTNDNGYVLSDTFNSLKHNSSPSHLTGTSSISNSYSGQTYGYQYPPLVNTATFHPVVATPQYISESNGKNTKPEQNINSYGVPTRSYDSYPPASVTDLGNSYSNTQPEAFLQGNAAGLSQEGQYKETESSHNGRYQYYSQSVNVAKPYAGSFGSYDAAVEASETVPSIVTFPNHENSEHRNIKEISSRSEASNFSSVNGSLSLVIPKAVGGFKPSTQADSQGAGYSKVVFQSQDNVDKYRSEESSSSSYNVPESAKDILEDTEHENGPDKS